MGAFDGFNYYRNKYASTYEDKNIYITEPVYQLTYDSDRNAYSTNSVLFNKYEEALELFYKMAKQHRFPTLEYINEVRKREVILEIRRTEHMINLSKQ